MSDNHRRYCAIKNALAQLCPNLKGHKACHLLTLTALICGIVGSHKTQLPAIASKAPGKAKRQSRITRYERFLKNKAIWTSVESIVSALRGVASRYAIHSNRSEETHEHRTQVLHRRVQT